MPLTCWLKTPKYGRTGWLRGRICAFITLIFSWEEELEHISKFRKRVQGTPLPWIMGRENRPWTKGLRRTNILTRRGSRAFVIYLPDGCTWPFSAVLLMTELNKYGRTTWLKEEAAMFKNIHYFYICLRGCSFTKFPECVKTDWQRDTRRHLQTLWNLFLLTADEKSYVRTTQLRV